MNLFDFEIKDIQGNNFDWSTVRGKKIMLVNTASECGYTFHYAPMEEIYQKYKDQNFTIIGIPSNDFGGQEPGTEAEIATFCQKNYGVTFPMMSKVVILGENAHPIYKWLKEETTMDVAWNFQKYLIDENGNIERIVAHRIEPNDPDIIAWIEGKE